MKSNIRNGTLYLSGNITVKTVNDAVYQQFQQAFHEDIHTLDFTDVTQADSACISLLLTVLRQASIRPTLHNLPISVQALAELYDIQNWLHIQA